MTRVAARASSLAHITGYHCPKCRGVSTYLPGFERDECQACDREPGQIARVEGDERFVREELVAPPTRRLVTGAIVMSNDLAPPGWCEIQRDDSPDDEDATVHASDDAAAVAVCRAAGFTGCAAQYAPAIGVLVFTGDDGEPDAPGDILEQLSPRACEHLPAWIAIVPEAAVRAAGLDVAVREFPFVAPRSDLPG